MRIHIIQAAEAPGSFGVAVICGERRRIAIGLAFDELLGIVATSLIDHSRTLYLQAPRPWVEGETHFGITYDQYHELLTA